MSEPTRILVEQDNGLKAYEATALIGATPVSLPTGASVSLSAALISRASLGHTAINDIDATLTVADVHAGFVGLTAGRNVFLPDVDTYPPGQDLVVADETGLCSETRPITIRPGAGTADTIPATSNNAYTLTNPWQAVRLRRGAANVWLIV